MFSLARLGGEKMPFENSSDEIFTDTNEIILWEKLEKTQRSVKEPVRRRQSSAAVDATIAEYQAQ